MQLLGHQDEDVEWIFGGSEQIATGNLAMGICNRICQYSVAELTLKEITVESCYLELGYFELPIISNSNHFPLNIPFQSLTMDYLKPLTS